MYSLVMTMEWQHGADGQPGGGQGHSLVHGVCYSDGSGLDGPVLEQGGGLHCDGAQGDQVQEQGQLVSRYRGVGQKM